MKATATEFLELFDCDDYALSETGAELVCTIKDKHSLKYNTVFYTYENLVLPEIEAADIACSGTGYCTAQEVIDYCTQAFDEDHQTCDSEYVSTTIYSHKDGSVILEHIDTYAQSELENKVYNFGRSDNTLAVGFIGAYNKRCSCSFTIVKPEPNYGEVHDYSVCVVDAEFIDAACADYDTGNYYHFNIREVARLVKEVNTLRAKNA